MRWETALRDGAANTVKINDHASPGLARLAMAEHPDLWGFFETREPPAHKEAVRLNGAYYHEQGGSDDHAQD
jgi:hypothetical protein